MKDRPERRGAGNDDPIHRVNNAAGIKPQPRPDAIIALRQLVYISYVSDGIAPAEFRKILDTSRLNNIQSSVTGLLLSDGRQFLQALEGEAQDVEAVFQRISADTRHGGISILAERMVARREFGTWTMAAIGGDGYRKAVDALLSDVSCSGLKAKFTSFAAHS